VIKKFILKYFIKLFGDIWCFGGYYTFLPPKLRHNFPTDETEYITVLDLTARFLRISPLNSFVIDSEIVSGFTDSKP
jgi:hypothetical protein